MLHLITCHGRIIPPLAELLLLLLCFIKNLNLMQTVQSLIRRRVLICVYTICSCSIYGTLDWLIHWLIHSSMQLLATMETSHCPCILLLENYPFYYEKSALSHFNQPSYSKINKGKFGKMQWAHKFETSSFQC